MNRAILTILIISILFYVPATKAEALTTPVGTIPILENNDKGTSDNKNNQETKPSPEPSAVPVTPTAKPSPTEEPKVSPSPQPVKTVETTPQPTKTPANPVVNNTNANTIIVPKNRDANRTTVIQTNSPATAKKVETAVETKPVVTVAPNKKITPPPFLAGVQVKGMNYYRDSQLPASTTRLLSLLSSLLLLAGLGLLKGPAVNRMFVSRRKKARAILREKEAKALRLTSYNFNPQKI